MDETATPRPKRPHGCPPGQGTVASQPFDGLATGLIGNPPHVRDPEIATTVVEKARTLLPERQIASLCGISRPTLQKYYRAELDRGRAEVLAQIAAQQVSAAVNAKNEGIRGDLDSGRFVLSRMLGLLMREDSTFQVDDSVDPATGIDLSLLTTEELQTYGRLSAKAAGIDPDSIEFEIIGTD